MMSKLVGRDRETMIGLEEEVEIEREVIVGGRVVEVRRDPKEAEVRIENIIGAIEVLTNASTKTTNEEEVVPQNPLPPLHPPPVNPPLNQPRERESRRRRSKQSKYHLRTNICLVSIHTSTRRLTGRTQMLPRSFGTGSSGYVELNQSSILLRTPQTNRLRR